MCDGGLKGVDGNGQIDGRAHGANAFGEVRRAATEYEVSRNEVERFERPFVS